MSRRYEHLRVRVVHDTRIGKLWQIEGRLIKAKCERHIGESASGSDGMAKGGVLQRSSLHAYACCIGMEQVYN